MELIDECTDSTAFSPIYMRAAKFYLKFIVISTLIMLLASNQAFSTVIFNQLVQREVNGLMME